MPHTIRAALKSLSAKPLRFANKCVSALRRKLKAKKEACEIERKRYKTAELSVADLLLRHSREGELLRCDIIVRLLAIEAYYGENDFGFQLYEKMQDARMGAGYAAAAVPRFKALIRSYEESGYDKSSGILLDNSLGLIDGSHRIALALYHRVPRITAFIVSFKRDVEYSIDWFIANGFTTEEVRLITDKAGAVLREVTAPFSCVIWSPAVPMADEIVEDLKTYGTVVSVRRYRYRPEEYSNIVRAVYAVDDIAQWKIEKKLACMADYAPELVAVDLVFTDPAFRLKQATGMPLSTRGERAKKALRSKYSKRIDNYFFDIILHIADNLYQSAYMRDVFEPGIDFSRMLAVLEAYPYALAKTDTPYMPEDFPRAIPVGKDVDVFCLQKDIEAIRDGILDVCRRLPYEPVVRESEHGIQLRLNSAGRLVFLVDLICGDRALGPGFVEAAIRSREAHGPYYRIGESYEYLYRLSGCASKPKAHHLAWLDAHSACADPALIKTYYPQADRVLAALREKLSDAAHGG